MAFTGGGDNGSDARTTLAPTPPSRCAGRDSAAAKLQKLRRRGEGAGDWVGGGRAREGGRRERVKGREGGEETERLSTFHCPDDVLAQKNCSHAYSVLSSGRRRRREGACGEE